LEASLENEMLNTFGALLQAKLEDQQKKNPRLSMRSFAKKMEISPGCLNELMHGKRALSEFYANKIVLALEMDTAERNKVYSFITTQSRKHDVEQTIAEKQIEVISSWQHFAILNLMRTKDFDSNPMWIADRLAITPEEAAHSLKLLEDLGFIKTKGKSLVRSVGSLSATTEIPSAEIMKAHIADLQKSIDVLQNTKSSVRDYSSTTLAINPEKMPEARKLIKTFHKKLSMLVEDGDKSAVYNLNVQFFPLTVVEDSHV
jgi:uncharacterized protein (TIGR02147 family)